MRLLRTALHTFTSYAYFAAVSLRASANRIGAPRAEAAARRKNLLVVAWSFPPYVSGGIYRPAALCRYAHESGRDVTVVAGPAPDRPSTPGLKMLEYLPSAVRIIRARHPRWKPSYRGFPRVDGGFLSALDMATAGWDASPPISPGAIVATGPPFANFIAGYYLARACRAPLVLDYRDEWTECPFEFVKKGNADRWWEERCLQEAALVVFTTASMLEHQAKVFKQLDRVKCAVIPNGFESADHAPQGGELPDKARTVRPISLLYTGNLSEMTPPGPFLKAVAGVVSRQPELEEKLRIVFLGQKSALALNQLNAFPYPRMLELRDQVPKAEAARMMQAASALLILNDPRLDRYVPGKLYEYVACRKPMLVYGAGGEPGRLISRLQTGRIIEEGDVQGLEGFIQELSRERAVPAGAPGIEDWLSRHTRQATSLAFLKLVDNIT